MNADLLQDLAQYKNYRERSVMMAARSLIGTFRCIMPTLLHKKDRGRPTEANITIQPFKYGEIRPSEFVPGAEILHHEHTETVEETSSEVSNNITLIRNLLSLSRLYLSLKFCLRQDDDSEWIDISHSSEEEISDIELTTDEKIKELNKSREKNSATKQLEIQKSKTKCELKQNEDVIAEKMTKASVISVERLLTDEDFKKIDVGLVKQQVTYAKRGSKRTHAESETNKRGELIKLSDIENIYKKRKYDKKARLESVKVCKRYYVLLYIM